MMLFVSALVLVIALFSAQELFAYHVKRPLSDESSSSNSDDYPILTAQTSLFSTSRDQDTQATRAARSKMSYLNTLISHHELYGTWQSTVGNETSPNKQGYSTLRYMEESNSYEESFDMVLCLYNGFYTNTNYSCVSFSEYIPFMPASSFNEENMTINLQQVTVHVAQGLNSEINQLGKECNVNCSVYFTNKTTGAPFVPSYDEDTDKNTFKLQFSIQSVDCGINIVTNQMSQEDNVAKSLIMSYSFVMSAAAWLQCFLCYFFARLFEVKKELCQRISQGTLKMINCFDLFIAFQCFFQLTTSYVLAFTAVPYLILVFYFQPKAMRAISQAQGDLKNKGLHRISLLNFALLVVSAVTAVLSAFFQRPDWMFFVFIFHQFPQIIQNYQTQRKYRWKECLVFLFVIPKILYMIYVLVAPQNLFRTSPDHGFSFVLFNILAFQLLILLVQRHYPMLCVKRKVVYQSFSIHERKPDEEMCSVCLENFEATPTAPSTPATVTSSTTSEGLDDSLLKTQTPVDTKMIMTPCNHQFHECCLRDWTKLKSVCPYCRFELPPLPEDDD